MYFYIFIRPMTEKPTFATIKFSFGEIKAMMFALRFVSFEENPQTGLPVERVFNKQQELVAVNSLKELQKWIKNWQFVEADLAFGTEQKAIRTYVDVAEIISTKDYRNQILAQAISHLNFWKNKYAEYNELKPIVRAIDRVSKEISKNEKGNKRSTKAPRNRKDKS